ncbi:uncharacterized protein LOC115664870 [Syzygium oleosum]|uniref:uncharacterized protein LOC115664870 n=1 Tax=Syzygium oleosum TaxID=219896 RepID=UPI0024BB6EA3|nr:uncharacterized protein LOC115664870 [Syzygium oleosum]
MSDPPKRFEIPRHTEHSEVEYPVGDGEAYVKHTTVVWVDVGRPELQPNTYRAYYYQDLHGIYRPLRFCDVSFNGVGEWDPSAALAPDGEVTNPDVEVPNPSPEPVPEPIVPGDPDLEEEFKESEPEEEPKPVKTTEITDFIQENNLLDEAMVRGISEIVKLCIQFFPELIWIKPYGVRLTARAVKCRQERTLRLFLKAVERWIVPNVRTRYYEHKTYWNRFVENHTELLKNGEKWAKVIANSCMLVSTLIATVLFAATFTMPGGNDDKIGVPLLLGKDSLLIFTISDALGLFSSVTAILLFLAILTSRYEAQDFLEALPKKIIMGLCFLFLSLAFMLVAFSATLTIVLDKRLDWVLIPITLLASLPVALFVVLQIPLLYQMVKSTYGPSIFRAESNW